MRAGPCRVAFSAAKRLAIAALRSLLRACVASAMRVCAFPACRPCSRAAWCLMRWRSLGQRSGFSGDSRPGTGSRSTGSTALRRRPDGRAAELPIQRDARRSTPRSAPARATAKRLGIPTGLHSSGDLDAMHAMACSKMKRGAWSGAPRRFPSTASIGRRYRCYRSRRCRKPRRSWAGCSSADDCFAEARSTVVRERTQPAPELQRRRGGRAEEEAEVAGTGRQRRKC